MKKTLCVGMAAIALLAGAPSATASGGGVEACQFGMTAPAKSGNTITVKGQSLGCPSTSRWRGVLQWHVIGNIWQNKATAHWTGNRTVPITFDCTGTGRHTYRGIIDALSEGGSKTTESRTFTC
ncbi:hypothetical protein NLX83_37565 [Allokutzneria sp. A3M-2-11 16]|uniref:hypothetical protein n=1 Tax=Allokutzneria sp. A3M-2-11 16 TaxID=2962043 RepID=UPI0020B72D4C|nr:hypothetical protein [Allokutzneria sp. A3M-2-11 16]MCP3804991.1 hypothetical protein [Allokutzneria sp. A3M-2-11 16]